MTLFEFKLLADEEKIKYLYKQGVYLAKRRQDERAVLLFQIEGFYVEVFYRSYRRYVSWIHCFSSTALLDPYLEQIDVEQFVER